MEAKIALPVLIFRYTRVHLKRERAAHATSALPFGREASPARVDGGIDHPWGNWAPHFLLTETSAKLPKTSI